MRAGANWVQHTLTAPAQSVLKHAIAEARRRGHAQVQPLHVAAMLLSHSGSGLHEASMLAGPTPLRALEVCFNVALDHLAQSRPATPSQPTLSNALVAALKRAHAHQRRRCCSEQQQPPLLAIKVELEQLIVSVLDDPSVSRVIKEAGSSSAHIKGNLEDNISSCLTPSTSIGRLPSTDSILSSRPTSKPCSKLGSSSLIMIGLPSFRTGSSPSSTTQFTSFRPGANLPLSICEQMESKDPSIQTEPVMGSSSMKLQELVEGCDKTIMGLQLNAPVESQVPQVQQQKMMPDQLVQPGVEFGGREDDVCRLIEILLRPSKRNALLVVDSDSSACANAVVKDLAILIKMGQVPEQLCRLKVLDPQLSSLSFASCSQLDMEQKLGKLSKIVDECMPAGAVLHLGDLQWLSDPVHIKKGAVCFCPAQHAAAELERLLLRHAGSRLWFVGVATQQVFVKCQARHPELEVQWGLQPLQVASSTSLYFSAPQQLEKTAKGPDSSSPRLYAVEGKVPNLAAVRPCHGDNKIGDKLQCCAECLAKFEQERLQLHELERLSLHLAPTEWCSLSSEDALNEGRLDMCSSQDKEHSVIQKLKELHRKWQETCQNVHAHLHAPVSSILKTEPSPLSKRLGNGTMEDGKTHKLGSITFPPQATRQGNSSGLLLSKKQLQGSSTLPYWAQSSPCSIGSVNSMSTAHVDGHLSTSHKRDGMVCMLDIGEPNDGSSVISASAEQEDMHGTSVTSVERGASLMSVQTDLALGRPSALTVSGSPISHSLKNTVMNCSPLQRRPQWQIHQEQMQGRTGGTSPLRGLQWQMVNSRSTELKLPPPATPALFINQGPLQAFQESIADSLKGLYKALLSRVGWQGEAVAAITSTVMNCRAGMGKMRGVMSKTDSWLLFLGPDPLAKQLIAKALTEMVSGSEQNLICLGFGDQAVSRLETDDNGIRYRGRSSLDRLAEAVRMKPFSVLLLEDIDKADSVVRASLLRAMERGKLVDSSGREVSFGNVIVLMTSNIGAESLVPEHSLGGLKFSVERLVALGGGAMRLLVEDTHSHKVLFQSQSNTAVVEWGSALPNTDGANGELVHPVDGFLKRKSDGPILRQTDPRVQVKRPKLSFSERPARALDLNLLAEENEEDSLTYGGNGQAQRDCRSSQEDESQSAEDVIKNRILGCAQDVLSDKFFGLLDHAVVFKAYDFYGLANHVLARLTKAFEGITMQGASLEVDVTVLEHILAAIWRGSTVFDTWVADVVGKSVTAVLADVTIAENTVVKLVGDMGRGCIRDSSIAENNTSTGPQLPLFIEISQST